jgi:hypothetical protein
MINAEVISPRILYGMLNHFCFFYFFQEFCHATRSCTTGEKCKAALIELGFPTGMPTGDVRTRPPKNKNDYFFAGAISANIAEAFSSGYSLGSILKKLRFKEAAFEGMLGNVKGRWQVMKSTVGTKMKPTWSNLQQGKHDVTGIQ